MGSEGGLSLGSEVRSLTLSKRKYAPAPRTTSKSTPKKKRRKANGGGTLERYFFKKSNSGGNKEKDSKATVGSIGDRKSKQPGAKLGDKNEGADENERKDCGVEKEEYCRDVKSNSVMVKSLVAQIEKLKEEVKSHRAASESLLKVEKENVALKDLLMDMRTAKDQVQRLGMDLEEMTGSNEIMRATLLDRIRELGQLRRSENKAYFDKESDRLGRIAIHRSGTQLYETCVDGPAFVAVDEKLKALQEERESIEKHRRELTKARNAQLKAESQKEGDKIMPPPAPRGMRPTEAYEKTLRYKEEQEEIYKLRMLMLRREESTLLSEKRTLENEQDLLIRELKRQRDEAASKFSDFPLLNDRYLLLNLLGRGGFSEVFKAFDLDTSEYVACKIHRLSSHWSEQKKANYVRHSTREYTIHKSLKHPRVVRLIDVFEIDDDSFCTVLEYCEGTDLDAFLKTRKVLTEREARSIISQVVAGLVHLAEQKDPIIHYDLKPGNILFHKGEARITDFGLSKIMHENACNSEGMELTSQGAGTMWYLPPECFDNGKRPPRISSKVDVWSTGVILYQMLCGRRPFGHNQTQQHIIRNNTIGKATLSFPVKPAVSDQAKDFIRRCLTHEQSERPSIEVIQQHPFLIGNRR